MPFSKIGARAISAPGSVRAAAALSLLLGSACAASSSPWDAPDPARGAPLTVAALAGEERPIQGAPLLGDTEALIRWLQDRNPEIAAARARVAQARADWDQSQLYPNPSAQLGWGGINLGPRNPSDLAFSSSQNYGIGVQQTIELGKRGPRIESARLLADSERQNYFARLGEKVADGRGALGRIVYLQAKSAILEGSLAQARQVLELEKSRLDHGDISGNDFDRLALDTSMLEFELPQLKAELEEAQENARAILGAEVDSKGAEIDLLARAAKLPDSRDEWDRALLDRPDLRAIERAAESARQDALLAERRAIPDPTFGIAYLHDNLTEAGNQENTLALTLGITLPLFDHGQHASSKAESHAFELSQNLSSAYREAAADRASLMKRLETLDRLLSALGTTAIPKSQSILDTTLAAYNRGQLSLTDLLLARRTHTDLVLRRMDLQFETFRARNELRRTLGLDAELAFRLNGGIPR